MSIQNSGCDYKDWQTKNVTVSHIKLFFENLETILHTVLITITWRCDFKIIFFLSLKLCMDRVYIYNLHPLQITWSTVSHLFTFKVQTQRWLSVFFCWPLTEELEFSYLNLFICHFPIYFLFNPQSSYCYVKESTWWCANPGCCVLEFIYGESYGLIRKNMKSL